MSMLSQYRLCYPIRSIHGVIHCVAHCVVRCVVHIHSIATHRGTVIRSAQCIESRARETRTAHIRSGSGRGGEDRLSERECGLCIHRVIQSVARCVIRCVIHCVIQPLIVPLTWIQRRGKGLEVGNGGGNGAESNGHIARGIGIGGGW